MTIFNKPALSIDDHIRLLKSRGLIIHDQDEARHILSHVSYYRLRSYWQPFEHKKLANEENRFLTGTTFSSILDHYNFDRHLRLLVMDAIERFEVSCRVNWGNHIAMTYGAHGYINHSIYDNQSYFNNAIKNLNDETERSKDQSLEIYRKTFSSPKEPPVWMVAEIISFGLLSKLIGNLKQRKDRQSIAKPFGFDERILCSGLHHLTHIRNICAHHGRLWNRHFTVTLVIPNHPPRLNAMFNSFKPRQIYNTLCFLTCVMAVVAPASDWKDRLVELLTPRIGKDMASMGFPEDWRQRWQLK